MLVIRIFNGKEHPSEGTASASKILGRNLRKGGCLDPQDNAETQRQDHFRLKRNHFAGLQNSDDDPHWQPR
jgi:hypothetical protein